MTKKIGADLSHYNQVDWRIFNPDFVFCKCTQGTTYLDQTYNTNKTEARKRGVIFGSYHFFRGDSLNEAKWFLKNIGELQEGDLLALDSETGQTPQQCLAWLQEVERRVGFKPLIYCPAGNGMDWTPVVKAGFKLWAARYSRQ